MSIVQPGTPLPWTRGERPFMDGFLYSSDSAGRKVVVSSTSRDGISLDNVDDNNSYIFEAVNRWADVRQAICDYWGAGAGEKMSEADLRAALRHLVQLAGLGSAD